MRHLLRALLPLRSARRVAPLIAAAMPRF